MSRLPQFSHPLLLGFDRIERMIDRVAKASSDGYPPYNIEQTGDDSLRITLAVAGFRDEDLSITLEDNQLVVRGRQQDDGTDRVFLHRGIAARQFQRGFVLAEGIEVVGPIDSNLRPTDRPSAGCSAAPRVSRDCPAHGAAIVLPTAISSPGAPVTGASRL